MIPFRLTHTPTSCKEQVCRMRLDRSMKGQIDNFCVDLKTRDKCHGYYDRALVSTLVECFICNKETRLNKKPFHCTFQS